MRARAVMAVVLCFLAFAAESHAQDPFEKFDRVLPAGAASSSRPGTHHATATLRVVNQRSQPIAGVPVVIYTRPMGWGGAPWPVTETRTSPDGFARFADVGSEHPMLCQVEPETAYRSARRAVPPVLDGDVDLGTVMLEDAMPLRGRFQIFAEDGSPFATHSTRITISEPSVERFGPRVVSGSALDGVFFLEHVPAGRFRFEVWTWVGKPTPFRSFAGEFTVDSDPARRNLLVTARIAAKAESAPADEEAEFRQALKPPDPLEISVDQASRADSRPIFGLSGRVVDSRGAAAAGYRVRGFAFAFYELASRKAYGITDSEGRFSLASLERPFGHLVIEGPCGLLNLEVDGPLADKSLSLDRIELEDTRGTPVTVTPPPGGASLAASFLADGIWYPCPLVALGRFLPGERYERGRSISIGPVVCRVEVPGRLPAVLVLAPYARGLTLDLSTQTATYELAIRSGGKPVPNAHVDVEIPDVGRDLGAVEIARLSTDPAGDLRIAGEPSREYRIHVHAPGFSPFSETWRSGKRLEISLRARSVEVTVNDLAATETAMIKRAGVDELVAVVSAGAARPGRVGLEPGRYDITVLDDAGKPVRGLAFAADARGAATVSLAADRRARVSVKLPPGEDAASWTAWLSRRIPPSGSFGAAISTSAGGFGAREPASVVADASNGTITVASSGTGAYFLSLAKKESPYVLRREVSLEADRRIELVTRPFDATLAGSMKEFRVPEFSHHGVAGPRLLLSAATDPEPDSAWDVVVGLPKAEKDRTFVLRELPRGTYVALHHLGSATVYAGIPVVANPGETVTMPAFVSTGVGLIEVRVHEAGGAMARGGSISIHDPMSDAWQAFLEIPTTASFAEMQISESPSYRLTGEPVKFASVGSGVLPFDVRMDDGRSHRFWRRVTPGAALDLTFPQTK